MRVRIIASNPKPGEKDISHLVGREFELKGKDGAGHYIEYGETGSYYIHDGEFEVIKEAPHE